MCRKEAAMTKILTKSAEQAMRNDLYRILYDYAFDNLIAARKDNAQPDNTISGNGLYMGMPVKAFVSMNEAIWVGDTPQDARKTLTLNVEIFSRDQYKPREEEDWANEYPLGELSMSISTHNDRMLNYVKFKADVDIAIDVLGLPKGTDMKLRDFNLLTKKP